MTEATFNSVNVEIDNSDYIFKSSGKTPVFDGFMKIYNTAKKEKAQENDEDESENAKLPELNEGDLLTFLRDNPILLSASCCIVLVVNGADG